MEFRIWKLYFAITLQKERRVSKSETASFAIRIGAYVFRIAFMIVGKHPCPYTKIFHYEDKTLRFLSRMLSMASGKDIGCFEAEGMIALTLKAIEEEKAELKKGRK